VTERCGPRRERTRSRLDVRVRAAGARAGSGL